MDGEYIYNYANAVVFPKLWKLYCVNICGRLDFCLMPLANNAKHQGLFGRNCDREERVHLRVYLRAHIHAPHEASWNRYVMEIEGNVKKE